MDKNILDFGAVADGKTLNTLAIQAAIDECAAEGGGKVTVPSGVYKCGTVWLKSHVELCLSIGAELLASDDLDDYNAEDAYPQNYGYAPEGWVGKHLIIAHEVSDVAISGFGRINGNCHAFVTKGPSLPGSQYGWCNGRSELRDPEAMRPGQLIVFIESEHIRVQDITIVDSPCWSCFFLGCEYVGVRGVRIFNPLWMLNSDGIDIDASRHVTVSDCIIRTGDDAITLRASEARVKNKADMHCEFVTVSNCILSTGICAFRIGVGNGVIRHARIQGIVIERCMNAVELCTAYSDRGKASIEDIGVSDITAVNTDRCINAFAKNGAYIKDITFDNIRSGSTINNRIVRECGSIENITLRNISLNFKDKYPRSELSEVSLERRGKSLVSLVGIDGLTLDGVNITGSLDGIETVLEERECSDSEKRECRFPE